MKKVFTAEEARTEANRCLECGCLDYYECRLLKYARQYQVKPQRWYGQNRTESTLEQHPFMLRDMNKCILCGLCVRICDEVVGAAALGLVERGFDTLVQPEMGLALSQTSCIACGQCIAVCPTGALQNGTVWQEYSCNYMKPSTPVPSAEWDASRKLSLMAG